MVLASSVIGMLDRLHVLVIGPGLGRQKVVLSAVSHIIHAAIKKTMPLVTNHLHVNTVSAFKLIMSLLHHLLYRIVIDADGLWLVAQNLSLIKHYDR